MSQYLVKLRRNIRVSYFYMFFNRFNISNTLWPLFLAFKGQSLVQIGLLESIYHISSLLLEIPTGMIADLWGRKTSLFFSTISGVIHCLFMLYSQSFFGYAVAFFFIALCNCLHSGAHESLVYDSCLETKQEEKYKKIASNLYSVLFLAAGLSLLLGGWISTFAFSYLYVGTIIVLLINMLVVSFFTEPQIAHEGRANYSLISQFKASWSIIKEVKRAGYLIIFSGVLFSAGTVYYFYCQQYFTELSLSRTWIGAIFALDSVAGAIAAYYAYKVEAKLKEKGLFILGILTIVINGLGLSFSEGPAARVFFFIMLAVGQSLVDPMFSDYINKLIPSPQRATIISMQSAAFSAVIMITFPLIGFIADKTSIAVAFRVMVVIFLPMAILCYIKLNPRTGKEQNDVKSAT